MAKQAPAYCKKKYHHHEARYRANCKKACDNHRTHSKQEIEWKHKFLFQDFCQEIKLKAPLNEAYNIYIKKLGERNIDRQGLLCPFIFETNSAETCFIEEKIPLLRNMGFGISAFGVDSFRIDEVPFDLQFIDMREFFDEILSELDNLKEIKQILIKLKI